MNLIYTGDRVQQEVNGVVRSSFGLTTSMIWRDGWNVSMPSVPTEIDARDVVLVNEESFSGNGSDLLDTLSSGLNKIEIYNNTTHMASLSTDVYIENPNDTYLMFAAGLFQLKLGSLVSVNDVAVAPDIPMADLLVQIDTSLADTDTVKIVYSR